MSHLAKQKSTAMDLEPVCFSGLYQQTVRQWLELKRIILNWGQRFVDNCENYHEEEAIRDQRLNTLKGHMKHLNRIADKIKSSLDTEQLKYAASKIDNIQYRTCMYDRISLTLF